MAGLQFRLEEVCSDGNCEANGCYGMQLRASLAFQRRKLVCQMGKVFPLAYSKAILGSGGFYNPTCAASAQHSFSFLLCIHRVNVRRSYSIIHSHISLLNALSLKFCKMHVESGPHFDWVESSTLNEVDEDFGGNFCQNEEDSRLHVTRFYNLPNVKGEGEPESYVHEGPVIFSDQVERLAVRFCVNWILARTHTCKEHPDLCQIFAIYQKNSFSRLYITRELFESLLSAYSIFSRIWDFILPYHFRTRQSDVGNAAFRYRQHESVMSGSPGIGTFGKTYSFSLLSRMH